MIEKALQNFGLSDKETKVYLAALELGISTIQDLSKKSEVNRATTYIQVESLKKKGLINLMERGKKTMIVAEKPQRLVDILEQKKDRIELMEKEFHKIMPDLEAIYNVKADRPRVRFIDTAAGSKFLLEEMMKIGPEVAYSILPKKERPTEIFGRLTKHVGEIKLLFMMPENAPNEFRKFSNVECRYYQIEEFKIDILLYQNRVVIDKPIMEEQKSTAVYMEDKLFYQSFLALFNIFWDQSQPMLP